MDFYRFVVASTFVSFLLIACRRFLFEEVLRGRASRYAQSRMAFTLSGIPTNPIVDIEYHRAHQRPSTPPETQQQYAERLRRTREEQEQAAERRAREEAHRKVDQEKERERGIS